MKQLMFFIVGLVWAAAGGLAQEYPRMGPDIVDPRADGEALVREAVTQARREDKRVLLLFGANWCPWTRRLHRVLQSDPQVLALRSRRFVLVYVDANTRKDKQRNAAVIGRFGNPLQLGIPVFVVLDRDGNQLTTQETQTLAAKTDAEVAVRVKRFLESWAR